VAPLSYVTLARQDATAAGINPNLFVRQIEDESGFNPDVVSPAGAIGIAQFMPGTAAEEGINPYNPVQSLSAAADFMANLSSMYGGDYAKALAAYNAGPGNVDYAVSMGGSDWIAYLPAETQNYLNTILY
jgi:soluble lytic murein transglycosylase-like protein